MSAYRLCAGVVVFNRARKVLVCARSDKRAYQWQFPQGGILKNEKPDVAAARELAEETSIRSVQWLTTLDTPLRYDFPAGVRRKMAQRGIQTCGQEMYWSLFLFTGNDSEINLATDTPEFKAWKWVEPQEAVDHIIYFKKSMYQRVVSSFLPLINSFCV